MDTTVKETEDPAINTVIITGGSDRVYMSKAVTSEVQDRDWMNFTKLVQKSVIVSGDAKLYYLKCPDFNEKLWNVKK